MDDDKPKFTFAYAMELEAKKAELEAAIATIKNLVAGSGNADGGSDSAIAPENVPVGAFLRLSIADATKKFLDMARTKQSVPTIQKALERGGLPPVKYTTLYTVLRRRESQIGDVMRLGDEWALTEWYPNNPNLRKQRASENAAKAKGKGKAAKKKQPTAKNKTVSKKIASKTTAPKAADPSSSAASPDSSFVPYLTVPDMAEVILSASVSPLDAKVIAEKLNANFNKNINAGLLKSLLGHDSKKRFKNIAENLWDLVERPEK